MTQLTRLSACMAAGLLSVALMGGCGAQTPATNEASTEPQADSQETVELTETPADLTAEQSDFPVGQHVDFEQVLFDASGLKVTATGFGPVSYYAALNLTLENTGTKDMQIWLESNSLNGWVWDASLVGLDDGRFDEGIEVILAPGESKNCGLGYSNIAYLEPCDIEAFSQIGFVLSAYEPDSGDELVRTPELIVDLPGAEGYAQRYDDSGKEVYSADGIRIVAKNIVEADWGEPAALVYVENLSDKSIQVTPASGSFDGKELDEDSLPVFADVPAGKRALGSPWLEGLTMDSELEISYAISKLDPETNEVTGDPVVTDAVTVTKG